MMGCWTSKFPNNFLHNRERTSQRPNMQETAQPLISSNLPRYNNTQHLHIFSLHHPLSHYVSHPISLSLSLSITKPPSFSLTLSLSLRPALGPQTALPLDVSYRMQGAQARRESTVTKCCEHFHNPRPLQNTVNISITLARYKML